MKPNSISSEIEEDSVLAWIQLSKSKQWPLEKRTKKLNQAFSTAEQAPLDTLKVKYFYKLSVAYLNLKDSANFRLTNNKTFELARKIGDSANLANAHWTLATYFRNNFLQDSAYYNYAEASTIFSSIGNDYNSARMLYNIAITQSRVKDYTGSENTTVKAIKLLKPLDKNRELYRCYNNLGSVSKDLREYERALDYYDNALEYLKKIGSPRRLELGLLNNIGVAHRDNSDYERAIDFFERVISSENLKSDYPELYARGLNNLAYSRFKSGNSLNVEKELKEALVIREGIEDMAGISGSYYNLAEFYLSKSDTSSALTHAQKAKTYALQSNNNERLLETLALMSKADPANAVNFNQQYIQLNDSLQQAERQIRNKFARIQFETEEVEAQNALLARQRQLWIGIAVGLLLLAIAIFVIISQRVKNQKLKFQQQQQEANNEIFSLMLSQKQKVEEGKQSEQKRISEELHDGVLGEMNGARMILVGLNQKSDEEAIAMRSKAIEKLQEVQEEIRTISHELSDAAYQKFHNFIISIQELLQAVGDSASLQHSFTYDEDIEWDDLSAEIKINLHRIIQESLTNCVKHAQAKHILLDFKTDGNTLLVLLKDDGKGFDTKKGKKGIGHKNISSRVEKIDGSWEVKSAQGEGTEVLVRIPIAYSSTPQHLSAESEGLLRKV